MRPPASTSTAPRRRVPLVRGLAGCVVAVSLVGCGAPAFDQPRVIGHHESEVLSVRAIREHGDAASVA